MTSEHNGDLVVVGIDGFAAALHAAQWAIDEVVSRDVPLRLVSCIDQDADVTQSVTPANGDDIRIGSFHLGDYR